MIPSSRFDADENVRVLWEDVERVFCRGSRLGGEGSRNTVLTVLLTAEHVAPFTLDRLAHEYELKDELDSAWAVRPMELVRENGERPPALRCGVGSAVPDRGLRARRTRHTGPAFHPRETLRQRARVRDHPRLVRRVVRGVAPELVLVSGYSVSASPPSSMTCIRCSSRRGLLASGKFDQYKRDIPYSTLAQRSKASSAACWARATPS